MIELGCDCGIGRIYSSSDGSKEKPIACPLCYHHHILAPDGLRSDARGPYLLTNTAKSKETVARVQEGGGGGAARSKHIGAQQPSEAAAAWRAGLKKF